MFSLYGVSGRLFRGSMEHLRHIGPVAGAARTHPVEGVGRDGREFGAEPEAGTPSGAGTQPGVLRAALASYEQAARAEVRRQPVIHVNALMTADVISVSQPDSPAHALQVLLRHGIGQAPVINATGVLVGLVTRTALLQAGAPDTAPAARADGGLTHLMITPVPAVAPDADIRRLAQVLLDTGLAGLPVVDDAARLVGFVSRGDILRAVATQPALDLWR